MSSPLTIHLLLLGTGLGALYFGAEWLVRGAARLAGELGVPPIVIGLTVVAMGTSAPELVVCLVAVLEGNPDLAIGNVLGSNLANIGLVLGVTALVAPVQVRGRVASREIPVMVAVTLLLLPLIGDGWLGRPDGAVLLIVFALYLLFVNRAGGVPAVAGAAADVAADTVPPSVPVVAGSLALIALGSIGLVLGGRAIVIAAGYLAAAFGVPDMVIGLTVVAVGTSLPELATALVAAVRRQADIAVGNIIGSNILNIVAILGVTATVAPLAVGPSVARRELPAVLIISILTFLIARRRHGIRRPEGALLLAAYIGLGIWLFRF